MNQIFPKIFSLSPCKEGSIKDYMIRPRSFRSWDMHLRKNLNEWEVEDMARLLGILDGCRLGDKEMMDERVWVLDEKKCFSVKSFNEVLSSLPPLHCPSQFIWNKIFPMKISFFLWLLWGDRIPPVDNLIWRGFITPNRCVMCGSTSESSSHLLLHC